MSRSCYCCKDVYDLILNFCQFPHTLAMKYTYFGALTPSSLENRYEKRTSSYFRTFFGFSKTSISGCLTIWLFVSIALALASPPVHTAKTVKQVLEKQKIFFFLCLCLHLRHPGSHVLSLRLRLCLHLRLLHTCEPACSRNSSSS